MLIHTPHLLLSVVEVQWSHLWTTQADSGQCLRLPILGRVRRTPNMKGKQQLVKKKPSTFFSVIVSVEDTQTHWRKRREIIVHAWTITWKHCSPHIWQWSNAQRSRSSRQNWPLTENIRFVRLTSIENFINDPPSWLSVRNCLVHHGSFYIIFSQMSCSFLLQTLNKLRADKNWKWRSIFAFLTWAFKGTIYSLFYKPVQRSNAWCVCGSRQNWC